MEISNNLTEIGQQETSSDKKEAQKAKTLKRSRDIKRRHRENNRKRREQEKEGNITDSNLNFINYIFKQLGITIRDAAKKAGYATQKVYYWMTADDCLLSQAEKLFAAEGIKLVVGTTKKETKFEDENIGVTIKMFPNASTGEVYDVKSTKQVLDESMRRNGRLAFLARDIRDSGLSLSNYAESTGVAGTQLKIWLEMDDIRISRLKKIVNNRGYKLTFSAEPFEKDKKD